MKRLALVLAMSITAAPGLAQRRTVNVTAATEEGRQIIAIADETGDAKKISLIEEFLKQHPQHEATAWLSGQLAASCLKTGEYDKAMAAAEKALALDPEDLETAHNGLKAAEASKNAAAIRQWAIQASELARKAAARPKGAEESDEEHKQRVDYAKQLDAYTEYSLYAAALQMTDLSARLSLFAALDERAAADSPYLSQAYPHYFLALTQAGDMGRAAALARKAFEANAATEEILAVAGDYHLREGKDMDRVLAYSARLVELAGSRPKPEGVSDSDWAKRKRQFLGLGHWLSGAAYSSQNKFEDADKELRVALPLLEGNDEAKAGALFHLGVANYKLGRIVDAVKFTEQCAAIKGPYQAMAARNLKAIRSEYRITR